MNYGRGTYVHFTILRSPELKGKYSFSFKPVSIQGISETPLHMNQVCYGLDSRKVDTEALHKIKKINIQVIQELYNAFPGKKSFFDYTQSKEIGNVDFHHGNSLFQN